MAYIERTQTAGDRTKGTFSAWFKRGTLGLEQNLFVPYADSSNNTRIRFNGSDDLQCNDKVGGSTIYDYVTDRKFRDPAAWYHICLTVDTTEGAAGDRVKIYINGVLETNFSTETDPSASADCNMNRTGQTWTLGNGYEDYPWFGEMSHVHWIDGTAYQASTFGSTDATSGIWKINPGASVTPGTNGVSLKMEDRTNLDLDSSSNAFTMITTGTLTATYDTPSNNFATMNPLENYWNSATLSNGNTTVLTGSAAYAPVFSTLGVTSGKWYWEYKPTARGGAVAYRVGVASNMTNNAGWELGYLENDWAYKAFNGDSGNNNSGASYGDTWDTGDIIGLALDATNSKLYFAKNNVWQDSGDPTSGATGTGALSLTIAPVTANQSFLGGWMAGISYYTSGTGTVAVNFGNGYFGTTAVTSAEADGDGIGAFEYAPPTGYFALCTRNIKAYGG